MSASAPRTSRISGRARSAATPTIARGWCASPASSAARWRRSPRRARCSRSRSSRATRETTMAHAFRNIEDKLFATPHGYDKRSTGFRRADLIGRDQGSVHMGFYMSELAPGWTIDAQVHSFEKGIFVMEGEVEVNRDGKAFRLGKHDFALIPTGTPHAFRNRGKVPVRWVEKCAPRPKMPDEWQDSFFVKQLAW